MISTLPKEINAVKFYGPQVYLETWHKCMYFDSLSEAISGNTHSKSHLQNISQYCYLDKGQSASILTFY